MKRSETRRSNRVPSSASVKLRWNGPAGDLHFARGKILNSSSAGLCIELMEPIKPHSFVSLDAPELKRSDLAAGGKIRHCIQKGSKYVVGVELNTSAKWN